MFSKNSFYAFVYTCCLGLFFPILFPSIRLHYFAPFLVHTFYSCTLRRSLWWALGCGFLVDLFSTQTSLGIYALNYCLTTWLLYRYKFYFFEDRLSTPFIMTFCFASLSALMHAIIFYSSGETFYFSWGWLNHQLLFLPFQDALYAIFIYLAWPLQLAIKGIKWMVLKYFYAYSENP